MFNLNIAQEKSSQYSTTLLHFDKGGSRVGRQTFKSHSFDAFC